VLIRYVTDRIRRRFEHGVAVAYFRDVVRPKILRTAPITGTTDGRCELHVLTSRQDWLNLIWALKSFYHASGRKYRLCIHDDGSVPDQGLDHLRRHFPDGRLILRKEADQRVFAELAPYPRCLQFRKTNLLAPKLFDFAVYLESDRMLLFDSDLLFFREPTALIQSIEDPACQINVFNSDCADDAYTVTPTVAAEHLGLALQKSINSGLGLIHRSSVRWDWIEEFLGIPGILDGYFWRIEQTLFALSASRFGVKLLPKEYTLYLTPGLGDRPFRHYVGHIRHLMYGEGIRRLNRDNLLRRLSQR